MLYDTQNFMVHVACMSNTKHWLFNVHKSILSLLYFSIPMVKALSKATV